MLERHGLALVVESGGELDLVGMVAHDERRVWEAVRLTGPAGPATIAALLGAPADVEEIEIALDRLAKRRLILKVAGEYAAVGGGQHRE